MLLTTLSKINTQRFLALGLFILSVSAHASETPLSTDTEANEVVMGKIEYELPDKLGILTLPIPLHWVGARGDGVEALWIDQGASPFKENVTLSILDRDKVSNPEAFLDAYIAALIKQVEHSTVSDVEKRQAHRKLFFERSTDEGQEIRQTALVIYTESNDKSYLLTLTLSRPIGAEPVDLDQAKID